MNKTQTPHTAKKIILDRKGYLVLVSGTRFFRTLNPFYQPLLLYEKNFKPRLWENFENSNPSGFKNAGMSKTTSIITFITIITKPCY